MSARPEKILAIQFKYFGDAVLMTPALRALRGQFPGAELHLLVPGEIAPIFQQLPWLDRVWPMPRRRGSASLRLSWPVIRALRRERFDRSVDFASNDRGAILSLLIGARRRLGWSERGGFWGRKFCYTERMAAETAGTTCWSSEAARQRGPTNQNYQHESARLAQLLSGWQIPPPASLESEIRADPSLADAARKILPDERAVLCHVASSQPKKEWPLGHWAGFYRLATAGGWRVAFTTAVGAREQQLIAELKKILPDARLLPAISGLPLFLAVLSRAEIFISGDTGPLHFAAGLGVPTVSLFGPTSPALWAPIGPHHRFLAGSPCRCDGNWAVCQNAGHCLAAITPEQVLESLQIILKSARPSPAP